MSESVVEQTEQGVVDLGQALGSLLRTYLGLARDVMTDLPGGPRAFQVLSISSEGACSNQASIATRLGLDRTVMTYLVDDLESAGLVVRRPDPADRRARQVVLTAQGEQVVADVTARMGQVEATVLGNLTPDETRTFRALLQRLVSDMTFDHSACEAPQPEC